MSPFYKMRYKIIYLDLATYLLLFTFKYKKLLLSVWILFGFTRVFHKQVKMDAFMPSVKLSCLFSSKKKKTKLDCNAKWIT